MSKRRVREALPETKGKWRMAQEAGLSLHQYRQCVRVANIPDEEFEELIEQEDPPTVDQLANIGRRRGKARKKKTRPCPCCGGSGVIPT